MSDTHTLHSGWLPPTLGAPLVLSAPSPDPITTIWPPLDAAFELLLAPTTPGLSNDMAFVKLPIAPPPVITIDMLIPLPDATAQCTVESDIHVLA